MFKEIKRDSQRCWRSFPLFVSFGSISSSGPNSSDTRMVSLISNWPSAETWTLNLTQLELESSKVREVCLGPHGRRVADARVVQLPDISEDIFISSCRLQSKRRWGQRGRSDAIAFPEELDVAHPQENTTAIVTTAKDASSILEAAGIALGGLEVEVIAELRGSTHQRSVPNWVHLKTWDWNVV